MCACLPWAYLFESFFASRSVSRSMRMSPSRMGPTVFRVMILPLFGPSRIRHFTCIASPCMPVLPMTSMTSAGVASPAMNPSSLELGDLLRDVVDDLLRLPRLHDGRRRRADIESACSADVVLPLHEEIGDLLFVAESGEVHDDLLGLHVAPDEDKEGDAALDGLRGLVGTLLDLPRVPGDLQGLEGLVLDVVGDLELLESRCHNTPHSGGNSPSSLTGSDAVTIPCHQGGR